MGQKFHANVQCRKKKSCRKNIKDRFRHDEENFTSLTDELAKFLIARMKSTLTIELYGETHVLESEDGETILDTALRNNLDAPYACMSGTCNSCQAKKTEGTVEMNEADALTDDEIASGEVLTCCARPTSPTIHIVYPD
jgi:ferredoxin